MHLCYRTGSSWSRIDAALFKLMEERGHDVASEDGVFIPICIKVSSEQFFSRASENVASAHQQFPLICLEGSCEIKCHGAPAEQWATQCNPPPHSLKII